MSMHKLNIGFEEICLREEEKLIKIGLFLVQRRKSRILLLADN